MKPHVTVHYDTARFASYIIVHSDDMSGYMGLTLGMASGVDRNVGLQILNRVAERVAARSD